MSDQDKSQSRESGLGQSLKSGVSARQTSETADNSERTLPMPPKPARCVVCGGRYGQFIGDVFDNSRRHIPGGCVIMNTESTGRHTHVA